MGLCGTKQGGRHSYTKEVHKPLNKEFITALQDACFGDQDNVGFAALPAAQQLEAEPSSYSQELFYARLGNKAPVSLARFASNPNVKNGCLSPEHAVELLLGQGVRDCALMKYRMARLFEGVMHPEPAVTPFQFLSFEGLIDQNQMGQFFGLFADFDEDQMISSNDMTEVITVVIEFAAMCQENALPEELRAFTNLTQEDKERGLTQWLLQFETPKNRRECQHWFESSPMELPLTTPATRDDEHRLPSNKPIELALAGLPDAAGVEAVAAH
eukprot:GEMP01039405.1.p1 GENE.GEMP01039405.1~~GEMP01039405.1.p1  ORF type:complete len:271 (+),score=67.32 GEMP01039405.1:68-880(+)